MTDFQKKFAITNKQRLKIFIGGTQGMSKQDIFNEATKYGNVKEVLVKDGYAFVEFLEEGEAELAIRKMNGLYFQGRSITADYAKVKLLNIYEPGYTVNNPRLFVGRLSCSVNHDDLITLFSKYGTILDKVIKEDFAFIEYDNIFSATKAQQDLNGVTFQGAILAVEEAKNRDPLTLKEKDKDKDREREKERERERERERQREREREREEANQLGENGQKTPVKSHKVYFGKIPRGMRATEILMMFSMYGEIKDVIMKDDYAFVDFRSTDSMQKALQELRGSVKVGTTIVMVQEAKTREESNKKRHNDKLIEQQNQELAEKQSRRTENKRYSRRSPKRSRTRSRSR